MLREARIDNLYAFGDKVVVSAQALEAASKMVRDLNNNGARCLICEDQLPERNQEITLSRFMQIFPMLGICVANWSFSKRLETVTKSTIYEALASDFHHLNTQKNIDAYKGPYNLRDDQINLFYLSDLIIPGQIKKDKEGFNLEYSPAGKDWHINFCLQEGKPEQVGKLALVHLSLIVEIPAPEELTKRIDSTLQSQNIVWPLFEQIKGKTIPIFRRKD